jgi:hypothetical protein
MRMKSMLTGALLTALLALPAAAAAQTTNPSIFVAPYVGGTFAGGDQTKNGALTMGAAAGWLGSRWGVEGDVAETPQFFEQDGFKTDRRVTTLMASALYRVPMGADSAVSAYAAGGFGLLRPRLAEAGGLSSVDVTQGALNVGGGLIWMKSGIGVRGDVRYVRGIGNEADDANPFGLEVSALHFLRVAAGLVVGF